MENTTNIVTDDQAKAIVDTVAKAYRASGGRYGKRYNNRGSRSRTFKFWATWNAEQRAQLLDMLRGAFANVSNAYVYECGFNAARSVAVRVVCELTPAQVKYNSVRECDAYGRVI